MYKQAAEAIQAKLKTEPKIGLILGTGLGGFAGSMEDTVEVSYADLPDFPQSTVKSHAGRFVAGKAGGRDIIVMQGRVHFYEGYSMQELAVPVQTLCALGVETLIITNASGGINEAYQPGELVLVTDHIKLDLDSPLRGTNPEELGDRFFDMTQAYTPALLDIARKAAEETGMSLPDGVYAYMGGPQFETPAEIRMLRLLGADLVGMSTVPEVITAAHCGMKVLAISCVTNMAAGMNGAELDHDSISVVSEKVGQRFERLMDAIIEKL